MKHSHGKPPRTTSERPRTPEEARRRGGLDSHQFQFIHRRRQLSPRGSSARLARRPTFRTLRAETTALKVKQTLLRFCICNILINFFFFFSFCLDSCFACLWIRVSRITPDASSSSCRFGWQKQTSAFRCSGISKKKSRLFLGRCYTCCTSKQRQRREMHEPYNRSHYKPKNFFCVHKKLRWSFARTHEDGRSRQIGAENRPFHPTAREI